MGHIKKPTIKIVLRKDKELASGKYPVNLRVTFNRKPRYYTLKGDKETMTCDILKWNEELGRYNRNRELNHFIESYEHRANAVLDELKNKDFTFPLFESKFFKKYESTKIVAFMNSIISKLKSEDKLGNAQVYKDTRNRLMEFNKNVKFEDVSLKFLKKFEKQLADKGNSTSSISIYLRTLRATYNKAVAEELIQQGEYPFKKFKIKTGNTTQRALSKNDMVKIINYKGAMNTRERRSLDYFIFSYLCRGMNLRDMAFLKWKENVIDDKIVYVRSKTANTKNNTEHNIIKIEPEIEKILDRYSKSNEFVFPILDNGLPPLTIRYRIHNTLKQITSDLREIATKLKIDQAKQITHYWARHTYATTLKRSGISTAVISEALGHSSEATTKAYLDKFEQTEIDNTFKHLI
jgi:integrase